MKRILLTLFIMFGLLLAGCTNQQQDINSFQECVDAGYAVMESYPRQCSAQGQVFVEELSRMETCENIHGGKWIESAQECEMISAEMCESMDGNFTECGSACRNEANSTVCTLQCVPYCSFE